MLKNLSKEEIQRILEEKDQVNLFKLQFREKR